MAYILGPWMLVALVLAIISHANALYSRNSPVVQLDGKHYDSLITQSNYTSIVEFYAPWCGHCQNLKPAYEKAAKNLAGLAKVAAVNCDEDPNKSLCGRMGVQGFPTLKIVKPGPRPGKPVFEDYQGPRSAKGIVDAVVDKIPNHVKRLQDKDLEAWLSQGNDSAKAILFTEKGTTSSLIRALAIDFLGSVSVAQVRSKEEAAVQMFGASKFPSLILLPGGAKEPRIHVGEMKKEAMVAFLSQVAPPNPDPAPKSPKAPSPNVSKNARVSQASASASKAAAGSNTVVLEDFEASGSPKPIVSAAGTPIAIPDVVPPVATLATSGEVESACLGQKTGTCVLAILPVNAGDADAAPSLPVGQALKSLAEIAHKHVQRKAKMFPFYAIPAENEATKTIRGGIGLKSEMDLEIIAINGKKGWWMRHDSNDVSLASIESFIDAIKLGDGQKTTLPTHMLSHGAEKFEEHDEL